MSTKKAKNLEAVLDFFNDIDTDNLDDMSAYHLLVIADMYGESPVPFRDINYKNALSIVEENVNELRLWGKEWVFLDRIHETYAGEDTLNGIELYLLAEIRLATGFLKCKNCPVRKATALMPIDETREFCKSIGDCELQFANWLNKENETKSHWELVNGYWREK